MNISYHKKFRKHFKKRILPNPSLIARFEERLQMFIADSNNPILSDHQLKGIKSDYRSFSVTGDIRVVYKINEDTIRLYDIGSHNLVY